MRHVVLDVRTNCRARARIMVCGSVANFTVCIFFFRDHHKKDLFSVNVLENTGTNKVDGEKFPVLERSL